ncbi:MAG: glycosyltransferase [Mangrovibacterium sp.]
MESIWSRVWIEVAFWIENYIFWYAIAIIILYTTLAVISAFVLTRYSKESKITNYGEVLSSPYAPMVSILTPAYNEELNIYENVKALLSLYYANYEVVVINDGSSDNTLDVVINEFDMEKVDTFIDNSIHCSEIRGIYRSRKASLNNLILIDKVNGGKADALNAGINVSSGKYFVAIDSDCVMDPHALQVLVKPFLADQKGKETIAVGGVIRIANSCVIEDGLLVDIQLPKKLLPLFQVIEYNRSFLLGRLAWGKLNGLLIISGALGMFNKEIVVECGGYSRYTVGEDMELVVRMRRYMSEIAKRPYKIDYLPDPLCWTEAPASAKILSRQRNRWTRGTIETLFAHWSMFLNPRYGIMGMMSHPFWTFFEWFAPIIEFIGLLYFVILVFIGQANWAIFFTTLTFVYAFALTLSSVSILYDHLVYFKYRRVNTLARQLLAAALEPFLYHPLITYAALRGNWDYFVLRKRNWGKMTRTGLGGNRQDDSRKVTAKKKGIIASVSLLVLLASFLLFAEFASKESKAVKELHTESNKIETIALPDHSSESIVVDDKAEDNLLENLVNTTDEESIVNTPNATTIDSTLPYQLIVGNFKNDSNAKRFIQDLKDRNIDAVIVPVNNASFISCGSFSSLEVANQANLNLSQNYPDIKGAWVYCRR